MRSTRIGNPVNTTPDARWDWVFRSLKKIEESSNAEVLSTDLNLNGHDIIDISGNVLTPRISLQADTTYYVGATPQTVTMTIASPCVVTLNSHGFTAGMGVRFSTSGALPTGIVRGKLYFVLATDLTTNTFKIAATPGGTAINTSGSQSGTHKVVAGSDDNDGTAATSTNAWITLQQAWDWVCTHVDLNGYIATLQFADGWYDFNGGNPAPVGATDGNIFAGEYCYLLASPVGQGLIKIQGNTGDKSAVVLTTTAEIWATVELDFTGGNIMFDYVTLRNDIAGAWGIVFGAYMTGGVLTIGRVDWNGTGGWAHIDAAGPCSVSWLADYSISGSSTWSSHCSITKGASTYVSNYSAPDTAGTKTVTLNNTPNFGLGFWYVASGGTVDGSWTNVTYSGSATGARFWVEFGGHLIQSPKNLNYFPGNAVGYINEGGQVAWGSSGYKINGSFSDISDETASSEDIRYYIRTVDGGTLATKVRFDVNGIVPYTHVVPNADISYDLGTSSLGWRNFYIGTSGDPMDDYDEGTFTPTLTGSGGNPTVTYLGQYGRYIKIGNLVWVILHVQVNTISGGAGNIGIEGLPFTVYNDTTYNYPMWPVLLRGETWGATPGTSPIAWPNANGTNLSVSAQVNNANEVAIRVADVAASDQFWTSGCYNTA